MILHPNAVDLTGERRGRLVVLKAAGRSADGHLHWLCRCDCGRKKHIASNSLLRLRPVTSCGCNNRRTAQARRQGAAWNTGKRYTIGRGEHCYKNCSAWAKAAIRHYGNRCEVCGWHEARCDVHHRHRKSRGGQHTLKNAIVLCPNHHRIEHEKEKKRPMIGERIDRLL